MAAALTDFYQQRYDNYLLLRDAAQAEFTAATDNDNNLKLNQALISASSIASMSADYIASVQPAVRLSAMRGDY